MPGTDDAAVRDLLRQTLEEDHTTVVEDWVRQQLENPGSADGDRELRREATELLRALRAAPWAPRCPSAGSWSRTGPCETR